MPFRSSLLAATLIIAPDLVMAQAPAASNARLAAYAGHTCSHTFNNGTKVFDDFMIKGGNVVTHHHSSFGNRTYDAGVLALQPAGDGAYRFKVTSGSVYVMHPQASPRTIAVTVTDGYGRGTASVTFSCR